MTLVLYITPWVIPVTMTLLSIGITILSAFAERVTDEYGHGCTTTAIFFLGLFMTSVAWIAWVLILLLK